MKKKSFVLMLSLLLIAVCTVTLVACDDTVEHNKPSAEWGNVYTMDAAYARAADLGYTGTLEEFIALISGKDGTDGKDGIDGADGKDGVNGSNGKDGVDGVGIIGIELDASGNLIISLSNNQNVNLGNVFKCNHSYSDWTVVLNPTCTSVGCDVRTCPKCNNKEYIFYEELGHNWDNGTYAIAPSCTATGLKIYSCSVCNATKNETIDRHNYVNGECTICGIPEPTEEYLSYIFLGEKYGYSVRIAYPKDAVTKVVIPETHNGLPVTEISINGFANCPNLEILYIPDSITKIGSNAFYKCLKLKNLHLPKSVTSIHHYAFIHNDFESITIDKDNPVYHSEGNCIIDTESKTLKIGCKNSVIPDDGSVIKIGAHAFWRCDGLTSIIIPQSIVEIEKEAFVNCTNLKTVYNLSAIDITAGATDNGGVAYYADVVYTSLDGDNTTYDSISLTWTDDLTGYQVLARNRHITNAIIPATYKGLPVKEIGDSAFANCTELKNIEIPNSITRIGDSAFVNCTELENVEIPNGVTRIGRNAFAKCTKLKSITIPNSVTSIGDNAFALNSFESITVEEGNPFYHSAGNCLIETESKTLLAGCKNSVIPRNGSVEIIKRLAFFRLEITSIVIPESIIEIENSAFRECTALKVVYNFSGLDITAGASNHGGVAHYAEVVYTSLDDDDTKYDSLTFTLTNKGDGYKVAARNKSITIAIIPATYKGLPVKEIGNNSFVSCTELKSVEIPNGVTRIGRNAFINCQNLKSITIPNSVTSIGDNAFTFNSFESITVEESNPVYHSAGNCLIETESKTLLAGCKNSVIPEDGSVEIIKRLAFFRSEITSIVIPESIVEIEDSAFRECTALKVVYNLSALDITTGSSAHGGVAYYAKDVYTSVDEEIA